MSRDWIDLSVAFTTLPLRMGKLAPLQTLFVETGGMKVYIFLVRFNYLLIEQCKMYYLEKAALVVLPSLTGIGK